LDDYVEETIPTRIYENIKLAKQCGLVKFKVCYPVLEDATQNDPVVVGILKGKMFEVGYWE
jgi:hypothetical protein